MTFKEICNNFNLPESALTPSAIETVKHIYYNWTQEDLQNFMNAIMTAETEQGEIIFEDDNKNDTGMV